MAWQPDEAAVGQVLEILRRAQTPDTAVQAAVQAELAAYQAVPEFNLTLAYIFLAMRQQPLCTRLQEVETTVFLSCATIILKRARYGCRHRTIGLSFDDSHRRLKKGGCACELQQCSALRLEYPAVL